MKKILFFAITILAGLADRSFAGFPPVQDRGAISTGTIFNISVTTNPSILLSTGNNVLYSDAPVLFFVPTDTTTVKGNGQYMRDRMFLEIRNDSANDVFIGYESDVSSITGNAKRGRKLDANGGIWAHDCSVIHHWIVAGANSTVTVTQER